MSAHESPPYTGPVVTSVQVYLNELNILSEVVKLELTEGINQPFVEGWIELKDQAGLLDNDMRSANDFITISWKYHGRIHYGKFYLDGVQDVRLSDNEKNYRINLKSVNALMNARTTTARRYDGTATDIISNIFYDSNMFGKIDIVSPSFNTGSYTVPMLPPYSAMGKIIQRSYDKNNNPLFMYEYFNGILDLESEKPQHSTAVISWGDMMNSNPKGDLSLNLVDSKNVANAKPGEPSSVIILWDHISNLERINAGVETENITTVNLNSSDFVRDDMDMGKDYYQYDKKVNPHVPPFNGRGLENAKRSTILNFGGIDQDYLFATDSVSNKRSSLAASIRSKTNSVSLMAYQVHAIPGLMPGNTVTMQLPLNYKHGQGQAGKSNKYKGKYVVSYIVHSIDTVSNNYFQQINVIRDGGPQRGGDE